jgi:hypothetical protein
VAVLVMLAAAVSQFVAWVGAVINTAGLKDKTWFIILLVTGLVPRFVAGPHVIPPFAAAADERKPVGRHEPVGRSADRRRSTKTAKNTPVSTSMGRAVPDPFARLPAAATPDS